MCDGKHAPVPENIAFGATDDERNWNSRCCKAVGRRGLPLLLISSSPLMTAQKKQSSSEPSQCTMSARVVMPATLLLFRFS